MVSHSLSEKSVRLLFDSETAARSWRAAAQSLAICRRSWRTCSSLLLWLRSIAFRTSETERLLSAGGLTSTGPTLAKESDACRRENVREMSVMILVITPSTYCHGPSHTRKRGSLLDWRVANEYYVVLPRERWHRQRERSLSLLVNHHTSYRSQQLSIATKHQSM